MRHEPTTLSEVGQILARLRRPAAKHQEEPAFKGGSEPDVPSRTPVRVDARNPVVLPFWEVLRFGTERGRRSAPIAEARLIFAIVALQFVVDFLGFGYRMFDFLAAFGTVVRVGLALALGAVFAIAYVLIAVGFVRKPLRTPNRHRVAPPSPWYLRALWVVPALGVAVVWSANLPAVWVKSLTAACVAVMAGASFVAVTADAQDRNSLLILVRVGLLLGGGFLVAEPLHRAFFDGEIRAKHHERVLVERTETLKRAQKAYDSGRAEALSACAAQEGFSDAYCETVTADLDDERLHARALSLVISEETHGTWNKAGREVLAEDIAAGGGAPRAQAVLEYWPTQIPSCGPMCRKYQGKLDVSTAKTTGLEDELGACRAARNVCQPVANDAVADLGENVRIAKEQINEPAPLGALQAAQIMDVLATDEASGPAVQRTYGTAWLLAMLLPIMLVGLRLSGTDDLESHLAGRSGR